MSALEKPHYCTTSCCYPSPRGGKRSSGAAERGGPTAVPPPQPRSNGFRFRAEISHGVKSLEWLFHRGWKIWCWFGAVNVTFKDATDVCVRLLKRNRKKFEHMFPKMSVTITFSFLFFCHCYYVKIQPTKKDCNMCYMMQCTNCFAQFQSSLSHISTFSIL